MKNSKKPKSQHIKKYSCNEIYNYIKLHNPQNSKTHNKIKDSSSNNKDRTKDIRRKNINTENKEKIYSIKIPLILTEEQREVFDTFLENTQEIYNIASLGMSILEKLNITVNQSTTYNNDLYKISSIIENEELTDNYQYLNILSKEQVQGIKHYKHKLTTSYCTLAGIYKMPDLIISSIIRDIIAKYNTKNKNSKARIKGKIIKFQNPIIKIPNVEAYAGIIVKNNKNIKLKLRPSKNSKRTVDIYSQELNNITDDNGYTEVEIYSKFLSKMNYNLINFTINSGDIYKIKDKYYIKLSLQQLQKQLQKDTYLQDSITVVGIDRGIRKIATTYSTEIDFSKYHSTLPSSDNSYVLKNNKPSFTGKTKFYTEKDINPKNKSKNLQTIASIRARYKKLRRGLQKEISKRKAVRKYLQENNFIHNNEKITYRDIKYISIKNLKKKLKSLNNKESRTISNINHCISKRITDNHPLNTIFVLEDLSGIRNATTKVRIKNRYYYVSWPFYDLEQKIIYKALRKGQKIIFVNPENTSKQCPVCKSLYSASRNRKYHHYKCQDPYCNFQSNDDRTAAINIAFKGIEIIPEMLALQYRDTVNTVENMFSDLRISNINLNSNYKELLNKYTVYSNYYNKNSTNTSILNKHYNNYIKEVQNYNDAVRNYNDITSKINSELSLIVNLLNNHYNLTSNYLHYNTVNGEIISYNIANNDTVIHKNYNLYLSKNIISQQQELNFYSYIINNTELQKISEIKIS